MRKLRVRERARDWRGLVRSATEHRSDSEAPESPTAGGTRDTSTLPTNCRCRRGTRPKEKELSIHQLDDGDYFLMETIGFISADLPKVFSARGFYNLIVIIG